MPKNPKISKTKVHKKGRESNFKKMHYKKSTTKISRNVTAWQKKFLMAHIKLKIYLAINYYICLFPLCLSELCD